MLEIRPDGSLKAENDLGIRKNFAVNGVRSMKPIPEIQTILEQFHEVFQGIGNIFDKKKKKNVVVKFFMKSGAGQLRKHALYHITLGTFNKMAR